ncbi:multidrug effflux MFS transporter [Stappia sp. F7233]|uniref:Bcr/CflA family efflux transporter n=2 Tax=Stappia albiluteola TaxID=2758565 RepID=A0A839A8B7_9HYPH|nr:multidrug effflux MFS transporter [Stappia albiluteola]
MSFAEFVAMIAALMALNALAIDVMLPALPNIGEAFDVALENDRQKVLIAYLVGFGGAQLVYGPFSDRFGRRPLLLGGLALYSAASVLSLVADSFDHLLLARLLQGIGCAAPRVVALSIVRDCYSGRQMGRVMSLAMMVFMAIPIVAPSLGQVLLFVAPWRAIFGMLLLGGLACFLWCYIRLPETLPLGRRTPLQPSAILGSYRQAITTRVTVGYMAATALVFGALFGFIASAQQIFVDVFNLGALFPLVFAGVALCMSAASFLNSRLVGQIGMRRLSHGALIAFTLMGILQVLLAVSGLDSLPAFLAILCVTMFLFGFIGPNFNALAMEPVGHIAGTASSVLGFGTTLGGAIMGFFVGQQFDGTIVPIALGYSTFGLAAVLVVLLTERGRLFHPIERTFQPSPARPACPADGGLSKNAETPGQ